MAVKLNEAQLQWRQLGSRVIWDEICWEKLPWVTFLFGCFLLLRTKRMMPSVYLFYAEINKTVQTFFARLIWTDSLSCEPLIDDGQPQSPGILFTPNLNRFAFLWTLLWVMVITDSWGIIGIPGTPYKALRAQGHVSVLCKYSSALQHHLRFTREESASSEWRRYPWFCPWRHEIEQWQIWTGRPFDISAWRKKSQVNQISTERDCANTPIRWSFWSVPTSFCAKSLIIHFALWKILRNSLLRDGCKLQFSFTQPSFQAVGF